MAAAQTREAKLTDKAAAAGYRLEHAKAGYRLVDAATGTLQAADWTSADGYGLTLDEIEVALQCD